MLDHPADSCADLLREAFEGRGGWTPTSELRNLAKLAENWMTAAEAGNSLLPHFGGDGDAAGWSIIAAVERGTHHLAAAWYYTHPPLLFPADAKMLRLEGLITRNVLPHAERDASGAIVTCDQPIAGRIVMLCRPQWTLLNSTAKASYAASGNPFDRAYAKLQQLRDDVPTLRGKALTAIIPHFIITELGRHWDDPSMTSKWKKALERGDTSRPIH